MRALSRHSGSNGVFVVKDQRPHHKILCLCLALVGALVNGCVSPEAPDVRVDGRTGLVIGSVVVEFARTRRGTLDGFFAEDLAAREPGFRLWFSNPSTVSASRSTSVRFEGAEPTPFVLSLPAGRRSAKKLEVVLYDGPASFLLGLVSRTDGREFPVELAFDVDPERVTYIGRIHILLPRKLQLFSAPSRVRVDDAYDSDRVALRDLLAGTPLPVEVALARPEGER